jgi:hypothetical protein
MSTKRLAGFTQEITYDGQLVICILTDSKRETVDAYIDSCIELMKAWDSPKSLNFLHDISHQEVALTPYFRSRLNEIPGIMRELKPMDRFHAAALLQNSLLSRIFKMFGETFSRSSGVKVRFFVNRQQALDWLTSHIEAEKKAALS